MIARRPFVNMAYVRTQKQLPVDVCQPSRRRQYELNNIIHNVAEIMYTLNILFLTFSTIGLLSHTLRLISWTR